MTKTQLIDQVARKAHLTKKAAAEAVDVMVDEIGRVLSKGEKVVITGFGTFRVANMRSKTIRIPGSEKFVTIKPRRVARFTPGSRLKKQVAR